MGSLYARGCGLDGHAKTGVAGLCSEGEKQMRPFSTMTAALWQLADGLLAAGCTHIAIASTGVHWRPVCNRLEDHFPVLLVNAHHIKAVPGQKTDVRDDEWIGDLLRQGLRKASVMPPRPIRAWRALMRHRQILVRDRAAVAHRIRKLLEAAHIKRGQVAAHVLGLSGRVMLQALADGDEDAEQLVQLARGKRKAQAAQLKQELTGHLTPTPRVLLQE
jgi:transposase